MLRECFVLPAAPDLSKSSGMCWLLCGTGWSWVPVGWVSGEPSAVLCVGTGCNNENSDKWRGGTHVVLCVVWSLLGRGKLLCQAVNSSLRVVMGAWGTLAVLSGSSCSSSPWKSHVSQSSSSPALFIQQLTLGWHHKGLSTTQKGFSCFLY